MNFEFHLPPALARCFLSISKLFYAPPLHKNFSLAIADRYYALLKPSKWVRLQQDMKMVNISKKGELTSRIIRL
jgi:hypothetical protein